MSLPDLLDPLPRLGLVTGPTPVAPLPELAEELGLGWLGAKRDDLCPILHGGTKIRKLDYLLAAEPWASARSWASTGAIGSGHLVATAAAAEALQRELHALCFWEPLSEGVLANLAFTATRSARLRYCHSRLGAVLRHPRAVLGARSRGSVVVPPGATCPAGMAGTVRGGLELAEQVRAGAMPPPDRIVVALGSGGTAVGIRLGLAMAGMYPVIQAVAAVERPLSTVRRLEALSRALQEHLDRSGVAPPTRPAPPLLVDRSALGHRYGVPTRESEAACTRLRPHGLHIEPLYSGKAMAALLAKAPSWAGEKVLFWATPRAHGSLPPPPEDWRDRLPGRLRKRLDGGTKAPSPAVR